MTSDQTESVSPFWQLVHVGKGPDVRAHLRIFVSCMNTKPNARTHPVHAHRRTHTHIHELIPGRSRRGTRRMWISKTSRLSEWSWTKTTSYDPIRTTSDTASRVERRTTVCHQLFSIFSPALKVTRNFGSLVFKLTGIPHHEAFSSTNSPGDCNSDRKNS